MSQFVGSIFLLSPTPLFWISLFLGIWGTPSPEWHPRDKISHIHQAEKIPEGSARSTNYPDWKIGKWKCMRLNCTTFKQENKIPDLKSPWGGSSLLCDGNKRLLPWWMADVFSLACGRLDKRLPEASWLKCRDRRWVERGVKRGGATQAETGSLQPVLSAEAAI